MHTDAKLLKYIIRHNIRGICDIIDPDEYVLILDRGFQELYDGDFRYDFIMPSLSHDKPTSCLEANISRLLIRTRFVNEKVYGDLEQIFPILAKQVIGQHKRYINSWSDVLVAALNYIHPNGAIINTNSYYDNYIRYCIGTKFMEHPMKRMIIELNNRTVDEHGRWWDVPLDWIKKLVPFVGDIRNMDDDTIR